MICYKGRLESLGLIVGNGSLQPHRVVYMHVYFPLPSIVIKGYIIKHSLLLSVLYGSICQMVSCTVQSHCFISEYAKEFIVSNKVESVSKFLQYGKLLNYM